MTNTRQSDCRASTRTARQRVNATSTRRPAGASPVRVFIAGALFLGVVSLCLPAQDAPPMSVEAAAPPVEVAVPAPSITAVAKVLSVRDGDTLKVRIQFECDVRLLGCWSPEITGAVKLEGMKARDNLQRLALGKTGIVHIPLTSENIGKATSMGRILGRVYVDGKDLSAEQVKAGFATESKE
jgi:endonuclease YncB( thermonuclease family)